MYDYVDSGEIDAAIFAACLQRSSQGTPRLVETEALAESLEEGGSGSKQPEGPQILIEYEQGADVEQDAGALANKPARSPFQQFCRSGNMTVTNLVGPVWCEVQYDYGLRQGRKRDIKVRPTTFKTSKGKEITVDTKVATRNDKRQKGGTAVHEKLEKEIHPVKVTLKVKTEEDKWGLRLLDMVSRLETLITAGSCRELPVFGTLYGQTVFGIIDEIRHNNDSLCLVDNKTRKSAILAPFDDTLKDRFQVMLYWKLLSDLISIENPFPFESFWKKLRIDPSKPFSERFIEDRQKFLADDGSSRQGAFAQATTLRDIIEPFRETILFLGVGGQVDRALRLVYWTRQPTFDSKPKAESTDLEAIAAALAQDQASSASSSAQSTPAPLQPKDKAAEKSPRVKNARKSFSRSSKEESRMIGTRKFFFKEDMIEAHVRDVLQWWHGERPPRGVDLKHTGRCNTCEYRDGCEWLEAKANAIATFEKAPEST